MDYHSEIIACINQLVRLGYHDYTINQIIANYAGSSAAWTDMSRNHQRRLAADLRRYTAMARKWHYLTTGSLR